jgi:hypothetical protein
VRGESLNRIWFTLGALLVYRVHHPDTAAQIEAESAI